MQRTIHAWTKSQKATKICSVVCRANIICFLAHEFAIQIKDQQRYSLTNSQSLAGKWVSKLFQQGDEVLNYAIWFQGLIKWLVSCY